MIITAGIYKGRKIVAPNEKITRPTLQKHVWEFLILCIQLLVILVVNLS